MTEHPIKPPQELVAQWCEEAVDHLRRSGLGVPYLPSERVAPYIAKRAAQWGWDQRKPQIQEAADAELQAVLNLLQELRPRAGPDVFLPPEDRHEITVIDKLIEAVRLQRRSLKQQAMTALSAISSGANDAREQYQGIETIRRALEALPDD